MFETKRSRGTPPAVVQRQAKTLPYTITTIGDHNAHYDWCESRRRAEETWLHNRAIQSARIAAIVTKYVQDQSKELCLTPIEKREAEWHQKLRQVRLNGVTAGVSAICGDSRLLRRITFKPTLWDRFKLICLRILESGFPQI